MEDQVIVEERNEAGRRRRTHIVGDKIIVVPVTDGRRNHNHVHVFDFLAKVFMPAGYPDTVSPDYLRYQILNALQAFCSSLAGLLSSRAILEGFGVGDASATATHAMLLTVLQDVFGRLTTIVAAFFIGSSLFPEAKTYRFLADILNDAAIVLDIISPLLNSPSLPVHIPGLRIGVLCCSASLRALCGIAAGGSKAAIALHLATPFVGTGDIGDLNAKDASKETVLALLGMLLGTCIVPHLTTPWPTYTVLFVLVGLHLAINYMAVRGLVLRSLNRQRTGIAWTTYRASGNSKFTSPMEASVMERIFERPGVIRDADSGRTIGHCTIGSSFATIMQNPIPSHLLALFRDEQYLLWYDHHCLDLTSGREKRDLRGLPRLHICLKEGHTLRDQLKAWIHATELCRSVAFGPAYAQADEESIITLIRISYASSTKHFFHFLKGTRDAGWNTTEAALMTGAPEAVIATIESGTSSNGDEVEGKKVR